CVRPRVVVIPINVTWAGSASSLGPAVAVAGMIMVMATVRKIAPINSAFLFIYELKTEPQEKFLFPDSGVSYSETANDKVQPRRAKSYRKLRRRQPASAATAGWASSPSCKCNNVQM